MTTEPTRIQLFGRSSSHFTRVAAIFAHELRVPFDLVVVPDLTSLDASAYGGHPARKIPTLRVGTAVVFGTENICRRIAELAGDGEGPGVVWPEHLRGDVARSAQELTWHTMSAEVQLVVGTVLAELPADNLLFAKCRAGMHGSLAWLEEHLARALGDLPSPRRLSLLEVTLFCLLEHLQFRPTLALEAYPNLRGFAADYGARPAARSTAYRYDVPPRAP